ncbi:hypothetical protein RP20_CCG025273 [Aedes albopictus]|nr:hypothetical protein RP20_CCG025273 [Aedes albopictus]
MLCGRVPSKQGTGFRDGLVSTLITSLLRAVKTCLNEWERKLKCTRTSRISGFPAGMQCSETKCACPKDLCLGLIAVEWTVRCARKEATICMLDSFHHMYIYLEKWLLYKKDQLDKDPEMSEEERQSELVSTIEAVFAHVRFAMMSPAELANVLTCPIFRFHKEFFVERVAIGMCYHSGRDDRIREIRAQENGTLQFTPRLYTNDRWSLSMMIDEFEKIENYQNFVWCFFSQKHLSECYEDQSVAWEIELFPRGVKYNRAMLIGVFNMPVNTEIPESIIRTVRLKVLCQERLQEDQRFRIGVLISGVQNRITHIRTCHVRTAYFSNDFRVLNIDNLIPYDELQLSAVNLSPHLIGEKRDTIRLQVIIAPLGEYACTDMPTFEFKDL